MREDGVHGTCGTSKRGSRGNYGHDRASQVIRWLSPMSLFDCVIGRPLCALRARYLRVKRTELSDFSRDLPIEEYSKELWRLATMIVRRMFDEIRLHNVDQTFSSPRCVYKYGSRVINTGNYWSSEWRTRWSLIDCVSVRREQRLEEIFDDLLTTRWFDWPGTERISPSRKIVRRRVDWWEKD